MFATHSSLTILHTWGTNRQIISVDSDGCYRHLYPVVVQVQRLITCSTAVASFGFGDNDNIGKFGFSAIQVKF